MIYDQMFFGQKQSINNTHQHECHQIVETFNILVTHHSVEISLTVIYHSIIGQAYVLARLGIQCGQIRVVDHPVHMSVTMVILLYVQILLIV